MFVVAQMTFGILALWPDMIEMPLVSNLILGTTDDKAARAVINCLLVVVAALRSKAETEAKLLDQRDRALPRQSGVDLHEPLVSVSRTPKSSLAA